MVHVEHKHVRAFAGAKVNLKKAEVDDQRAQVQRLRGLVEAKVKAEDGHFALIKSLHAGSVAKGTALSSVNDRDLAVYVATDSAPHETGPLVVWLADRVRECYPTLASDQITENQRCVTVVFRSSGLSVDVVPVLYDGAADDVGVLVDKATGLQITTSVTQHLNFIRSRKAAHPVHLTQMVRLSKWWVRQQKKADGDFKCKSFMVELLWAHLADDGVLLSDYPKALEMFFAFITDGGFDKQIAFADFHPASGLPSRGTSPMQVLDPVNFDNNVAGLYLAEDRKRLEVAAGDALDAITTARFEPVRGAAVSQWQEVLGPGFRGGE